MRWPERGIPVPKSPYGYITRIYSLLFFSPTASNHEWILVLFLQRYRPVFRRLILCGFSVPKAAYSLFSKSPICCTFLPFCILCFTFINILIHIFQGNFCARMNYIILDSISCALYIRRRIFWLRNKLFLCLISLRNQLDWDWKYKYPFHSFI